jgi:hypothetical protein
MTIRPSIIALIFYLFWSFATSLMLFIGVPAIFGYHSGRHKGLGAAWLAAFILFGLFLVPLLFIRCRLEGDRIRFRNYYRSYSFRWNEIAAVELVPAALWTVDTSWSMYPRCHLRTGDSVDIRALIHMRKKKAYAFKEFVERKAAEFGFKAEIDAEALRN